MGAENPNGVVFIENDEVSDSYKLKQKQENVKLYTVLNDVISSIFLPNPDSTYASTPLLYRIKGAVSENVPLLREASRNTGHDLLLWTRRGSHLRALLVVSVGTITLLSLTGLLVFMLFFLAATFNAIIISLLVSLAVAGGFLALFFTCVTVIYIGALSIAAFVIFTATITAIVAVLIAAGWVGFFFTVWLAVTKSVHLAKYSLSTTGSALSAYCSAWHAHPHYQPTKLKIEVPL